MRRTQQCKWLWSHVNWQLLTRFKQWPGMSELVSNVEERVVAGDMAAGTAADQLLDHFFNHTRHK